jgi:hypothetical protein
MGYTTEFTGRFELDRPLSEAHAAYLNQFSETRRMKRNAALTEARPDPLRIAAGLPVGKQGAYFVNEDGFAGQGNGPDVLDHNLPPKGQPGLWCQWVPSADRSAIEWNGGEKFYYYTEWLEYIIEHFLKPWGYVLNGEVAWDGEDRGDIGKIVVDNNSVKALNGRITYGD